MSAFHVAAAHGASAGVRDPARVHRHARAGGRRALQRAGALFPPVDHFRAGHVRQGNPGHFARRLSHRHDAAGEPDLRARLSLSTFDEKKSASSSRTRASFCCSSASSRPICSRAKRKCTFRGRNEIVFRKRADYELIFTTEDGANSDGCHSDKLARARRRRIEN
jgi:hypothetical protein